MRLYVDGVLQDQIRATAYQKTGSSIRVGMTVNTGGGDQRRYSGSIDDIRLYNRVLSEDEILELFFVELTIATDVLSVVKLGNFFSQTLEVVGGESPFTWSVVDGMLPLGVDLGSDGVLSGTPPEAGEFDFTVRVTDSNGDFAEKEFTLEVLVTLPPPEIRAHKVGTTPVPGRVLDYFVVLENIGISRTDVHLHETLLPPSNFTFVSADPSPDFVNEGFIFWNVSSMEAGEFRIIRYSVRLNPAVELGSTVTGTLRIRDRIISGLTKEAARRVLEQAKLEAKADWDAMLDKMEKMACTNKNHLPRTREAIDAVFDICVNIDNPFKVFGGVLGCPFATANASEALNTLLKDCKTFPDSGICNPPENWFTECTEASGPIDPNEKLVNANTFIQPDQLLVYPIHFENIGDVEALDVFVTDVLDPNLDISTLEILTPEGASFDPTTRTLHWELIGRNLQPGETGNVLFSIRPLPGLPSGTVIPNSAEIQFEIFDPLVTPEVVNIIDSTPPSCEMDPLQEESLTPFPLSWSGSDEIGEIDTYAIFVSEDGSGFTPFLEQTTETSALFEGDVGATYEFICIATDTAGNTEVQDPVAETATLVVDTTNNPPIALCQDVVLATAPGVCTASSTPDALAALIDAGSSDPNDDPITLAVSPTGPFPLGETAVTLLVEDDQGASDACDATVSVVDQEAPQVTCPASQVVECTSPAGAPVSFDVPASDNCTTSPAVTCEPASGTVFPFGATPVSCEATDAAGNMGSCGFGVTVQDTIPPVISSVSASPSTLFPPNHKMVPVSIAVTAADTCDTTPVCQVIEVSSNEPEDGLGDGSTESDWAITGALAVSLRAERAGTGSGRVYTVTIACTDTSGNVATGTTTVTVLHDQGNK